MSWAPALVGAATCLVLLAGCGPSPGATTRDKGKQVRTMSNAQSSATARLVSIVGDARPPKSTWTFDLELHNGAAEARWFLLANPLEVPLAQARRAPGASLHALDGSAGPVPVVTLSSTQDVLGVYLPAGASLTLTGVALQCWLEDGAGHLEVWASPDLQVDGTALHAGWFAGHDLLAPPGASTAAWAPRKRLAKHLDGDFDDFPVTYTKAEAWSIALDLTGHDLPWADPYLHQPGPETFTPPQTP